MLGELPTELLAHVFSFLAPASPLQGRRKHRDEWLSLSRLCRTCKLFQHVAQPLLYRVYVKPKTLGHDEYHQRIALHRSLHAFLSTVLARPNLANCTRHLSVELWETEYSVSRTPGLRLQSPSPDKHLCTLYANLERKLISDGTGNVIDWTALNRGVEDAEIALLFTLLPNLSYLKLEMPEELWPIDYPPSYQFSKLVMQPACLLRVQTLHLWSATGTIEAGFPISPCSALLTLPSLRNLNIDMAAETHLRAEWCCEPGASNVSTIELEGCVLSPKVIAKLVQSCKSLKTFRLTFGPDTFSMEFISWPSIIQALQTQQHNIETLILDCDNMSQLVYERLLDPGSILRPIGSLQGFKTLRDLTIRQIALLGPENHAGDEEEESSAIDLLPCTIESLTIRDCSIFALPLLEHVLSLLSTQFCRFKVIDVEPINLSLDDPDIDVAESQRRIERISQLRNGFRAAGVKWKEYESTDDEDDIRGLDF